jgi:outer membrane protein insertion porin family
MNSLETLKGPLRGVALFLLLIATGFAESPRVQDVQLFGELPFEKEKALEILAIPLGSAFEPDMAQDAAERLRKAGMNAYYPMAGVSWKGVPDADGKRISLQFSINLGPKGRLQELKFTGVAAFAEDVLLEQVQTRPRPGNLRRLLRKDKLELEVLSEDMKALKKWYVDHGYAGVNVGSAILEKPNGYEGFRLTWPIEEGPLYRYKVIALDADTLPQQDDLKSLISFQPGDVYNPTQIAAVRKKLFDYFYYRGYAFVTVDVRMDLLDDVAEVDVEYTIRSGNRPMLRDVRIFGNAATSEHILLREMDTKPGEVFNAVSIERTQARLMALPMFSKVDLRTRQVAGSDLYDVDVEVKERKTGRFEIGLLYGEAEGASFQANLIEQNFSLSPPFRGDGMKAGVSTTVGSELIRVDTQIGNPRMGMSVWSLDGQVYYEDNQYLNDDYSQQTVFGQLISGYPIASSQLLSFGFAASSYHLYDLSDRAQTEFPELEDDIQVTSAVAYWDFDNTDSGIRPTTGVRLRAGLKLGTELLGGNTDVVETSLLGGFYYNPYRDHVIAIRGSVESAKPYGSTQNVPAPLRKYLGGSRNLRGFDYRSVSAVSEDGVRVGGESLWWASVEYMVPLHHYLEVALYVDVGDVSADPFGFSGEGPVSNAGIGFLIRADNFPVRFDLATPLQTLEDDTTNETGSVKLSFSAGYRFY